jgi:hypothetical protein
MVVIIASYLFTREQVYSFNGRLAFLSRRTDAPSSWDGCGALKEVKIFHNSPDILMPESISDKNFFQRGGVEDVNRKIDP